MDITQITPSLYVGSNPSRTDALQIARAGITHVVDLRGEPTANGPAESEGSAKWAGTGVRYLYVPMRDNGSPIPASKYATAVDAIESAIRAGGKVLVHCSAGQYRSPSVAYAYLRKTGIPADAAWALIARRRGANRQYVGCVARYLAEIGVPGVETIPPGSPGGCGGSAPAPGTGTDPAPAPMPDGGKTPTVGPGGPVTPKDTGSSVGLWIAGLTLLGGVVWLGSQNKPRHNPGLHGDPWLATEVADHATYLAYQTGSDADHYAAYRAHVQAQLAHEERGERERARYHREWALAHHEVRLANKKGPR